MCCARLLRWNRKHVQCLVWLHAPMISSLDILFRVSCVRCVDCWMGINWKCERSRMTHQTYGTISLGTRSSFETNEERREKWKETERHGRGSRKYFSWIFMIKVYYYCRRSYEANGIPNIRWCHMELNARQMVNVLPTIGPRVRVSGVRKYKKR